MIIIINSHFSTLRNNSLYSPPDSGLSTYLGIQSAGRNVSPIDDGKINNTIIVNDNNVFIKHF